MKGAMYGIKNLQRIVPNLQDWTKMPNRDYSSLREMYNQVTGQFSMYMGHVAKYIGGVMQTPKMVEEKGPVYEVVSKSKQREAAEFLNRQLFATPSWLINKEIFDRTGINAISTVGSLQDATLNQLLSTRNLSKLIDAEEADGSNAYTMTDLLTDLKKGIWTELSSRSKIDVYRRNLQKSYIGILDELINPPKSGGSSGIVIMVLGAGSTTSTEKSDIISVVRAHLASLRSEIRAAANGTADSMSRFHLQDILVRIDNSLNPK